MGRKKQEKEKQALQDRIDVLLSWVKPNNDTEKQAIECGKYELRKILGDNERMQLRDVGRTTTLHAQVKRLIQTRGKRNIIIPDIYLEAFRKGKNK